MAQFPYLRLDLELWQLRSDHYNIRGMLEYICSVKNQKFIGVMKAHEEIFYSWEGGARISHENTQQRETYFSAPPISSTSSSLESRFENAAWQPHFMHTAEIFITLSAFGMILHLNYQRILLSKRIPQHTYLITLTYYNNTDTTTYTSPKGARKKSPSRAATITIFPSLATLSANCAKSE